MRNNFFNCKGKNHRYLYFIIVGILLGSLLGSIVQADDSFGNTNTTPTIKEAFENALEWELYYLDDKEWIDITKELTVNNEWNENESLCKTTVIFIAPFSGDYKVSVHSNIKATTYKHNQLNNKYEFTYKYNNIEYELFFDYSDISTQNLTHNMQGGMLSLEIPKNGLKVGTKIIIDPYFGNTAFGGSFGIANHMAVMVRKNVNGASGVGKYVRVRLANMAVGCAVKCALYDGSANLLAETEERVYHSGSDATFIWHYFNFTREPDIDGDTIYGLGVMANDTCQVSTISISPSAYGTYVDYNINYPVNFPDPMTFDNYFSGTFFAMQCYYVNDGTMSHTDYKYNKPPYNISLDNWIKDYFNITVTFNHTYGDDIETDTYIYIDGQYIEGITEHGNRTISVNYFNYFTQLNASIHNITYSSIDEDGNYKNTTFWFNITDGDLSISGIISFDTEQFYFVVVLLVWWLFIAFAEWKKDFIYFVFCAAIALILGVQIIIDPNLHYIYGVIILLSAVYFSILAFHYGMEWNKGRLNE